MIAPRPSLGQLAEAKIRRWLLTEPIRKSLQTNGTEGPQGPVITISSENSRIADRIANSVGKFFKWEVVETDLMAYLVSKYGTIEALSKLVDQSYCRLIEQETATCLEELGYTRTAKLHQAVRILWLAASRGQVVLVGKVADAILPEASTFSVGLVSPSKSIERGSLRRTELHGHDLVVNLQRFPETDATEIIARALGSWLELSYRPEVNF